jgi:hypothetical protein
LSEKSWISVSDVCRCDANVIALIIWRTEKAEGKGFLKHLEKYIFHYGGRGKAQIFDPNINFLCVS